jgi:hypothetical protein
MLSAKGKILVSLWQSSVSLTLLIFLLPQFSVADTKSFSFSFGTYPLADEDLAAYPAPPNSLGLDWHKLEIVGALSAADQQRLRDFRKVTFNRFLQSGLKMDNKGRICWAIPAPGYPKTGDRKDYAQFVTAKIPVGCGPEPIAVSVVQLTTAECLTAEGDNFGRTFNCRPNEDGSPKNPTDCANDESPQSKVMDRKEFNTAYSPVTVKGNLVTGTYHNDGATHAASAREENAEKLAVHSSAPSR